MFRSTILKSFILAILITLTSFASYSFAQNLGFVTSFGTSGTGPGEFTNPFGLTVDTIGDIYVADRDNHRMQKLDIDGMNILTVGTGSIGSGNGEFDQAYDVVLDSLGDIYVADRGNNRIQIFDNVGNFDSSITDDGVVGTPTSLSFPLGVAIDGSDNIYISDTGNNRIVVLDSSLNNVMNFGSTGSAEGQFSAPSGITFDAMGNIYVADVSNHRIQVYDSSGVFQFMFGWGVDDGSAAFQICTTACQAGMVGTGAGQFNFPRDLAVDSSGNIYVVDALNHRTQVFDPSGNFDYMFGWGVDDGTSEFQFCTSLTTPCQAGISGSTGDGQFGFPSGIFIDGNDNLFVAGVQRIQVFSQTTLDITGITGNGTVTSSPAGIDCGSTCSSFFLGGEVVDLTANPDAGNRFVEWTGADCGDSDPDTDNPLALIMDMNRSCAAEFIGLVNITVDKAGNGTGTVMSTPAGIDCDAECTTDNADFDINSMVTLTAVSSGDSSFDGFTGDADCLDGIIQDLTADIICTATFTLDGGTGSCAIAGPNTTSSSLFGLLLYAIIIPAVMFARRRFRTQ